MLGGLGNIPCVETGELLGGESGKKGGVNVQAL